MSRIRDAIFATIAATTLLAALGTVPALADEVAAVTDETVAKEIDVAANATHEAVPAPEARLAAPAWVARLAPPAKPKTVRVAQTSPGRPAAGPQYNWNCSGFWCGRQFVLMLGVGY
jgi:hypothetical protein